jgi:hypothetical protein
VGRVVMVAQQLLLAGRVKRGSGTSDETAAVAQRSVMSDRCESTRERGYIILPQVIFNCHWYSNFVPK